MKEINQSNQSTSLEFFGFGPSSLFPSFYFTEEMNADYTACFLFESLSITIFHSQSLEFTASIKKKLMISGDDNQSNY